jgi:hypothetical protein
MIMQVRHESKCIMRTGSIDQWDFQNLYDTSALARLTSKQEPKLGKPSYTTFKLEMRKGSSQCSAVAVDKPMCRQRTASVEDGLAARRSTELRQGLGHYED